MVVLTNSFLSSLFSRFSPVRASSSSSSSSAPATMTFFLDDDEGKGELLGAGK